MKLTRRDFIKIVTGILTAAGLGLQKMRVPPATNLRDEESVFPFVEIVNEEGTGGYLVPPDFAEYLRGAMEEDMPFLVGSPVHVEQPLGIATRWREEDEDLFAGNPEILSNAFAQALALAEDAAIMKEG